LSAGRFPAKMSPMPDNGSHAARSKLPETRYQPLVIVLTAVVLGIITDRFRPLPLSAWLALVAAALVVWAVVLACARRGSLVLGNIFLLLAVAATAGAWHHYRWNLFSDDDLSRYARRSAQPVCVEAIAVESPRAFPPRAPDPMQVTPESEGSHFTVELVSLRNGSTWQPVSGRATLSVIGPPPLVEAGDRVRCFARLTLPEGPQNPGEFDNAAYLRADRVRSRLQAETTRCVSVVAVGSEWNLWRQLQRVRTYGSHVLERYLNPRRAELASAVLLGLREELDSSRREAFLTTGTVHILCISGLHVGILAGALFWIMRRMPIPRGWAVAAIAIITVLYALMVDAGPSVVRATILVLIACVAAWRGHRSFGFNSLAAAALVVLALNPAHLFHIGAQLSFLCIAGLIWFAAWRSHEVNESDKADKVLNRLIMQNLSWPARMAHSFRRSAIGIVQAGVVLWLLTLPLVMARFHVLSLVGLGLNAVLWPLISVSLLSGFGVLLFGTICPPLAWLFGWLCDTSFALLEGGINMGHQISQLHFWLPGPADWWLWGFYGVLGLVLAFPRLRPSRRWCAAILVAWIGVGFAVSAWQHHRDNLDCTFLSVGHGCAVVIEFPTGETMLYDAGQMGAPAAAARTISDFLWDRGLRRLDTVVLSHPDIDHFNALPELLDKFSVGKVCVSPAMFAKENPAVAALRLAIDGHGVPVRELLAGDRLQLSGNCSAAVLHPQRNVALVPGNANSLVLAVEYRGRRIVLPGDLESPGLDDMLKEKPRPCEVLMAPHHGSRKSNSPGLAEWCKPHWVVFSGDGRWNLKEIDSTYRAVGSRTLHTYNCGAIQVRIDGDGVKVKQFVEPR
jgi:competence protein ComEC